MPAIAVLGAQPVRRPSARDGQPKRTLPVFINVTGSWLNVSEYGERTMANSSAAGV